VSVGLRRINSKILSIKTKKRGRKKKKRMFWKKGGKISLIINPKQKEKGRWAEQKKHILGRIWQDVGGGYFSKGINSDVG